MFWRTKKKAPPEIPSVDNEDDFIDWLLRYSNDFADFRAVTDHSLNRFVKIYSSTALEALGNHDDEASLNAHISQCGDGYDSDYRKTVETMNELRQLPSHLRGAVLAILVPLCALVHMSHHKYGTPLDTAALDKYGANQGA